MMPDISLLTTFYAFSAGALWLLGLLFLLNVNRVNDKGNRWLGASYCILGCTFTQLFFEGFRIRESLIIHLLELPRWAMLPCFYMAISYLVSPSSPKKDWHLHFAPVLLFLMFSLVYILPGFFNVQARPPVLPSWIQFMVRYFFFGQTIFYWFTCFILFRRHNTNIKMVSSFTEKIDLAWVKYLLIALLFLILIRMLGLFNTRIVSFSPALYFLGVTALAYLTLTQKSIYPTETYELAGADEANSPKPSYERLTLDQVEQLKNIILEQTTVKKLYLDPGLTLSVLSDKTGISPHELSYVLNNGLGKNFYQFINELRTEEAKSLLLSEEAGRLDLLGVATRAGFNSKTTFYTTFKKATGLTSREYIKANAKAS